MPDIIHNSNCIDRTELAKFKRKRYNMSDIHSVYTHYDPATGRNVETENKLKGDVDNGKGSK